MGIVLLIMRHSPLDTVGDIIDHATENDEWGNFVINGERFYSGKYVIMNVPEEIRSKHIRNANCSGGWGNMNYYIETY